MAQSRKNPTITSATPKDEVVEGFDRLPIAVGVNQKAMDSANEMPAVDMSPNDGDNPAVSSPAFATGKDIRNFEGGPSGNAYGDGGKSAGDA